MRVPHCLRLAVATCESCLLGTLELLFGTGYTELVVGLLSCAIRSFPQLRAENMIQRHTRSSSAQTETTMLQPKPLTHSLTAQAPHPPAHPASKATNTSRQHSPSHFFTHDPLTPCAFCCIRISLSISCTCCSSLKASAHGTPNNNADVLRTHNALPPNPTAREPQV